MISPPSHRSPRPLRPDPEVRPPEYRVPRGRSGHGARAALDQLVDDLGRIRRAREYYGDLPPQAVDPLT